MDPRRVIVLRGAVKRMGALEADGEKKREEVVRKKMPPVPGSVSNPPLAVRCASTLPRGTADAVQ